MKTSASSTRKSRATTICQHCLNFCWTSKLYIVTECLLDVSYLRKGMNLGQVALCSQGEGKGFPQIAFMISRGKFLSWKRKLADISDIAHPCFLNGHSRINSFRIPWSCFDFSWRKHRIRKRRGKTTPSNAGAGLRASALPFPHSFHITHFKAFNFL